MADTLALITPPLGGKFEYRSSALTSDLSSSLHRMTKERDEAESREIAALRVAVAVLAQAFGGEVFVDAALLPERLPQIRTEHDARTGKTRVWLDPKPHDSGSDV